MSPKTTISHEPVDDMPVIVEWLLNMHVDKLIDKILPKPHGKWNWALWRNTHRREKWWVGWSRYLWHCCPLAPPSDVSNRQVKAHGWHTPSERFYPTNLRDPLALSILLVDS